MGLLDLFNSFLEWLRSLFFKREMELCIIGLNYAGKSTLVDVLASGKFNQDLYATVGFNMRKITKGNVVIKLWDIGGQPRFRDMWSRYCRGVDAIVYVVDAADHERVEEASKLLHELTQRAGMRNVPLLVLGNKNDLDHALSTEQLSARMHLSSLKSDDVSVYSISCKEQTNIQEVLRWLTRHAK